MEESIADYELGKRHLANIMGEDPDSFTQEDIDVSMNSFSIVSLNSVLFCGTDPVCLMNYWILV